MLEIIIENESSCFGAQFMEKSLALLKYITKQVMVFPNEFQLKVKSTQEHSSF